MTSNPKKPGVAFWATVVVVAVLVGYPLSFGPACWLHQRIDPNAETFFDAFFATYAPLVRTYWPSPRPVRAVMKWYVDLWLRSDVHFIGHYESGAWFAMDLRLING